MLKPLHVHQSQIAFGDTDCSGWIHFPKIFRHVEEAEHAYLEAQGITIISREEGGWPRVHVACDFKSPLRFGDRIEVQLGIERLGAASVSWVFEVLRDGEVCAHGKMTTVRVDAHGKPLVIDDATRAKLAR
ncbi:acyl-CoA thioesterase [Luteolibacter flavescens]|uniref:Acyl-CoA thioesterase n=1 Tax=Luteolibacter flavescens TaxID=1859460 RepID=A0ABT3FU50_9BACT|nr:thioesterase family protein [Luteolibacter flavescens]MCW1886957.1 acyl-CoA thioesterase [Luteolibacter flavescens]